MGRYLTLLGVLASLGGCAGLADPYQREGTWHPTQINDENLRLMVVNPVDLQQGRAATDSLGATSALAVARYRSDNVKTLPDSNLSGIGGGAGSGGQGGGGGGASTGATQ
jgi:hypothetical protein